MVPPQHQERFTVIASNITGSPPDFRVPAPRPQPQDDALTDSIAAMYGEDRAAQVRCSPASTHRRHLTSTHVTHTRTHPTSVQELESEMFAHTAMSLGMEQEDLLFNLLYFGGEGAAPDINMAISNARDETVALHSENNTPYKLRPASATDIDQLKSEPLLALESLVEPDCAVCKDDMEIGVEVIFLPACGHCFHQDCLVRWVKLQGFCPVCRAPIGAVDAAEPGLSKKKPPAPVGRDLHALTIAVLEDEEVGICVGAGPSLVPGLAARPGDGPPGPPLSYRLAFDVDPASSQEDVRADVDGGGSSSSSAAVVVADSPRVADAEIASAAALAASARDAAVALTTAAVASYSHKVMPTAESKDDYSKCGFTRGADSGKAYATNKGQKYVDDDDDDDDDDGGGSGARLAESKYDDGDDADENYIPSGAKSGKDE